MELGAIIWYIAIFGCAGLFVGIGIYATKLDKPMWFWSGSSVDAQAITDVKSYNKENGKMWLLYSLWYWASGVAYILSVWVAVTILLLGCSLGIGILISSFRKITQKYHKA